MGFENKEEFRPILTTAKELLIASGEVELVKILNSAELSVYRQVMIIGMVVYITIPCM